MAKVKRLIREAIEDEIVDEALQAKMAAALGRSQKLTNVRWLPRTRQSPPAADALRSA